MSWLKKFLPIGEERRPGVNYGFQVLKNTNTFVAIEPWFDFICGINGRLVVRVPVLCRSVLMNIHQEDGNSYLFSKEIENCAGRDVAFSVWSAKVSPPPLRHGAPPGLTPRPTDRRANGCAT